jgi:hypothetical protein
MFKVFNRVRTLNLEHGILNLLNSAPRAARCKRGADAIEDRVPVICQRGAHGCVFHGDPKDKSDQKYDQSIFNQTLSVLVF